MGKVETFGDWVVNKPNPLMQAFYMVVINASFVCFLLEVRPLEADHSAW